jgi:hypothetical protein
MNAWQALERGFRKEIEKMGWVQAALTAAPVVLQGVSMLAGKKKPPTPKAPKPAGWTGGR